MAKIQIRTALLCTAGLVAQAISPAHAAHPFMTRTHGTSPSVTVSGVAVDNSSAKIDYQPVPGAKDYRVLDVSDPGVVKYAGMMRYLSDPYGNKRFVTQADGVTPVWPLQVENVSCCTGPETFDMPSAEIEWNMLGDGKPHTLIVQAVDQLGPAVYANQYDGNNNPLMPPMAGIPSMLGSDEGPTDDGLVSINGQGPHTDTPHVIAQSAPFVVHADSTVTALPSRPDAQQTFLDTFGGAQSDPIAPTGSADPLNGAKTYSMGAGTSHPWHIQYLNADITHSMPSVMDGHFMDTLFDGSTPGVNNPLHVAHGVMAMSPDPTANFSGGRMLHATMEVDAHIGSRRWVAFNLAPANDPLTNWYGNGPLNKSDRALFVEVEPGTIKTTLFDGPTSPTDLSPHSQSLTGSAGQAAQAICRCYGAGNPWHSNGHGLDNRSRLDLFVTTTHFAYFEDGGLVAQGDIPNGLGFDAAKVYFAHYLYHSDMDHQELASSPWETYWLNQMPYSDERHWDNMGFEVLPSSAIPSSSDWSSLATLVHMPRSVAPVFNPAAGAPTVVAPSATNTPPALPVATDTTATTVPSATGAPSQTPPATAVPSVTASATTIPSPTTTSTVIATATTPPTATPIDASGDVTVTATPPGIPGTTSTTPTASTINGLPSGQYTVETRIIDAQGNVKLVTTAPLVIP